MSKTLFIKNIHAGKSESEVAIIKATSDFYEACHCEKPFVIFAEDQASYFQLEETIRHDNNLNFFKMILINLTIGFWMAAVFGALFSLAIMFFTILVHLSLDARELWLGYTEKSSLVFMIVADVVLMTITEKAMNYRQDFKLKKQKKQLLELFPEIRNRIINLKRESPNKMLGALISGINSVQQPPIALKNIGRTESLFHACISLGSLQIRPDESREIFATKRFFLKKQNPDRFPLILQKASRVSNIVDEILLMTDFAIVLPGGKADIQNFPLTEELIQEENHKTIAVKNALEVEVKVLKKSLEWSVEERFALQEMIGMEKFVQSLKILPIATDDSGSLYRIGQDSNVNCYIRVEDKVHENGQPLVHWISVPQHILTPHEGVAWSFGLSDTEYQPTAET